MYKYNQSEFESMMDELMHDFKKGCGKSEAELDVAYKILNPSPVGLSTASLKWIKIIARIYGRSSENRSKVLYLNATDTS